SRGPLHDRRYGDTPLEVDNPAQGDPVPLIGRRWTEVMRREPVLQIGRTVSKGSSVPVISQRAGENIRGINRVVPAQPPAVGEIHSIISAAANGHVVPYAAEYGQTCSLEWRGGPAHTIDRRIDHDCLALVKP